MKSIIQTDGTYCFNCKMAIGTETHHIFGKNPQRKYSDADGLTVRMCSDCHCKIHNDPDESGPMMRKYHQLGQEKWEAYYGPKLIAEGKDPREVFRERYGKNYL